VKKKKRPSHKCRQKPHDPLRTENGHSLGVWDCFRPPMQIPTGVNDGDNPQPRLARARRRQALAGPSRLVNPRLRSSCFVSACPLQWNVRHIEETAGIRSGQRARVFLAKVEICGDPPVEARRRLVPEIPRPFQLGNSVQIRSGAARLNFLDTARGGSAEPCSR